MEQFNVLRAVAQRVISTPTEDLPRIVGFLSNSLSRCSWPVDDDGTRQVDMPAPLQKLNICVSSLLHDRSSEGRFAAAVLIKPLIETVSGSDSNVLGIWARGLISCLNKGDPPEAKKLYLSSVTRIFAKCQPSTILVREVVSPLLPTFITNCLKVIKPFASKHSKEEIAITNALLPTVLRCWLSLIHDHPTTFRPFISRIRPICLTLLDGYCDEDLKQASVRLLASLHRCAPRNGSRSDMEKDVSDIIRASHHTLDILFRPVLEEWTSNDVLTTSSSPKHDFSKVVANKQRDLTGLAPWSGSFEGLQRLQNYLRWLRANACCREQPVDIPLSAILDLTARIHSVTVPSTRRPNNVRLNSEVGRDEKEGLWTCLPLLHASSLQLLRTLCTVFGQSLLPVLPTMTSQAFEVFEAESWHRDVREQTFCLLTSALTLSMTSSLQFDQQRLYAVCRAACDSLRTHTEASSSAFQHGHTALEHSRSRQATAQTPSVSNGDKDTQAFLDAMLRYVPASALPHSLRAELDRTAILTGNVTALCASVINPTSHTAGQRVTSSLLPFLARASDGADAVVETLLRPRMPTMASSESKAWYATEVEGEHPEHGEMGAAVGNDQHHPQASSTEQIQQEHAELVDNVAARAEHVPRVPPSEHPMSEIKKRDFAEMHNGDAHHKTVTEPVDGMDPSFLKKPRTDDTRTDIVNGGSDTAASQITANEGQSAHGQQQDTPAGQLKGFETDGITIVRDSSRIDAGTDSSIKASRVEDSDSDSPIPEIDASFTTDDEDDEDDEDEVDGQTMDVE